MGQIVCITHNDLDGYCAAAIVNRRHPYAQIMLTNYNFTIDFNRILPKATVYLTDFTPGLGVMKALMQDDREVIWIDHHDAAIRERSEQLQQIVPSSLKGIRNSDRCGAYLTWKYLYPNDRVPKVVELVDDLDRWQWKLKDTKSLFYGLDTLPSSPGTTAGFTLWSALLQDDPAELQRVLDVGSEIRTFVEIRNSIFRDDLAYQTTIDGMRAVAINNKTTLSTILDGYPKLNEFDAMLLYAYHQKISEYRYGIYGFEGRQKVVETARKFGGLGHDYAAGFKSPSIVAPATKTAPRRFETVIAQYRPIKGLLACSIILRQFFGASSDMLIRSHGFIKKVTFGEGENKRIIPAFCINYSYLPEIEDAIAYCFNIFSSDGNYPRVLCSWVYTKEGVYRYCIKSVDPNITNEELAKSIPDAQIIDGYIWSYSDENWILNR